MGFVQIGLQIGFREKDAVISKRKRCILAV